MSLKFGCSVMFWALVWCSINWSHWDLEILVLEEENQPDNLCKELLDSNKNQQQTAPSDRWRWTQIETNFDP